MNENGVAKKCIVPLHWVNEVDQIVYWPPQGKKPIHYYTSKWLTPDLSWQVFELVKISLEKGTREMCNDCLFLDSELSHSDFAERGNVQTSNPHRESPDIMVEKVQSWVGRSPKHVLARDFSSGISVIAAEAKKKLEKEKVCKISLFSGEPLSPPSPQCSSTFLLSKQLSQESTRHARKGNPLLGNYREPPTSFKCMDQRQWQYAFFMEMAEIKSSQRNILAAIESLGRRTELESSSLFISKCHSLEEFDSFEQKLESNAEFSILIKRLKQLGGGTPSQLVSKCINQTLDKSVQAQFNKTGSNGKRAFKKTLLCKAILAALVSDVNSAKVIDSFIGEQLKRAPRALENELDKFL
ncbi:uncharacterized protein LOC124809271 isoform X2 [Hydra vulgaris]|uniref:uncharacterized protein LOC124809271 isoform X2 n=1 Tax=Hydra vulgaris TaxID=6087 RepID=UPI001F5EAE90|nr:uncharacterized protein LOC124809271 isoform X2 [Hydra vulgaris]